VTLDSPLVAALFAVAGGVLGYFSDRFAVRWPEHDPEDAAEHPAGRPLGWRTLVVVAVSAVAFGLLPGRFADEPLGLVLFGAWFVTLVIGLATDLDQRLLPDVLTLPVIPVALVVAVVGLNPLVGGSWIGAVIAAVLIPAILYLPSIPFGAGAFGLGDVKLLIGAGLLLGLSRSVSGVVAGLLLAGLVLVILLAARRIGRRSYVPFGPFLIIGALWAVLLLPGP
jgi:prepilin signal peptidase PulO-like enzyme (type II secretory pathway)